MPKFNSRQFDSNFTRNKPLREFPAASQQGLIGVPGSCVALGRQTLAQQSRDDIAESLTGLSGAIPQFAKQIVRQFQCGVHVRIFFVRLGSVNAIRGWLSSLS